MAFDPENDSPDEQFEDLDLGDIQDDEVEPATCTECGGPIEFGECIDPTCPECPDYDDDISDEGDDLDA